jgi:sensor histidine kinase YesM
MIRHQMVIIVFLGFFLPVSVIFFTLSYFVSTDIKLKIERIHGDNLSYMVRQVEERLYIIDQFQRLFITNPLLSQLLMEVDFSIVNSLYLESVNQFENSINSFTVISEGINIGFVSENRGKYILKGGNNSIWQNIEKEFPGNDSLSDRSIRLLLNPDSLGNSFKVISFSRKFHGSEKEDWVVLAFFLDPDFFLDTIHTNDESLYLINFNSELFFINRPISTPVPGDGFSDKENLSTIDLGKNKMMILKSSSGIYPFSIVQLFPQNFYNRDLLRFFYFFIAFLILSTGLIVLIYRFLTINISQPVEKIVNAFELADSKKYNIRLDIQKNNEFGVIAKDFNKMMISLRRYIKVVKRKERQKRIASLRSFQMQINPHFINNTLLSARAIAERYHETEVAKILGILARLINNTIRDTGSLITIKDEIDRIESYLYLINTRYNNNLNISISIDEDCLQLMIPQLVLQPIIENAIEHGLQKRLINNDGNAQLKIAGKLSEKTVIFEVFDNGIGMTDEQIKSAMLEKRQRYPENSYHIGLSNIQNRILYKFGKKYGLTIGSEVTKYSTVSIKLPLLRKVNEE